MSWLTFIICSLALPSSIPLALLHLSNCPIKTTMYDNKKHLINYVIVKILTQTSVKLFFFLPVSQNNDNTISGSAKREWFLNLLVN